jgi:hypothetical protein
MIVPLGLILFAAGFIQGLTGFGFGMVAMSLTPIFVDVKFASIFIALLCAVNNFFVLWSVRKAVSLRRVFLIFLGGAIGIPIGIYLLKTLDAGLIKKMLGIVLVGFSGYSLLRRGESELRLGRIWAMPMGILSGVLNGIINMGGPPVIIYTYHKGWDKRVVKAALVLYFTVMSAYKVGLLVAARMISTGMLKLSLILIPIMFIGTVLGFPIFERINKEGMRRITFGLLLVLGVLLILRR